MKKILGIWIAAMLFCCVLYSGSAIAGQLDRAVVMISVDDGLASVYSQVYPILIKKYGLPFMACIPTGYIDMDSDHVTSDQVVEMGLNGVGMCNHGDMHLDPIGNKYSLIAKDLKTSQTKWKKLGFPSVSVFAYPFGTKNDDVVKAAKAAKLTIGRGSYDDMDQFNYPNTFDQWWIESLSYRTGTKINPSKTSNADQMKKYIDGAVENKAALSIVLHGVYPGADGEYELDSGELDETAAYLSALRAAGIIDVELIDMGVKNLQLHSN